MTGLGRDFQFALRSLIRQPAFAFVAIFTLALGFGATTAIFSVVNAVVLKPLPFERSSELMLLFEHNRPKGWTHFSVATGNFVDWARESRAFDSMAAVLSGKAVLAADPGAEQVAATRATSEYFRVLRAQAARGRAFLPEDDRPQAEPVVVISHGLWVRRLGGREQAVGESLTVDGVPRLVVGVMPPGFGAPDTDVWIPLTVDRQSSERGGRTLRVLGRLAAGVTPARAAEEMNAIADRLAQTYPAFNDGWGVTLMPLADAVVGSSLRRALYVLLGAVGLLMVIACVNVANLQSVRALARSREMAIRLAIGASRWRIARLLLVESLVLAAIGGAIGLLVAAWGREALLALAPAGLPRLHEVELDWRVLAFGATLVLSSAVLFGLFPATGSIASRADGALRGTAGRSGTATPSRRRASTALVAAEVGMSVVLLIGAGLLLRSFMLLSRQDPGFTPEGALTFEITAPESRYRQRGDVTRYYDAVRDGLRTLPGVIDVGGTHALPFTPINSVRPFIIDGEPARNAAEAPVSDYRMVTPGYFAAAGIAVKRGRAFSDADTATSPSAAIVNEAFVSRYFAGRDPLGRRLRQAGDNPEIPWMTIVGVVANVRHHGLASVPQPEMYWLHSQATWGDTLNRLRRTLMIVVRAGQDPSALGPQIRAKLAEIDPEIAPGAQQPLEDLVAGSAAASRFALTLMSVFAGLGLALAVAGVYGVVSFSVASRTREFGIRLALGAAPRELLRRVLRGGLALAAAGVAAGLIAAALLVNVMRSQLFEVPPRDLPTFVCVAAVLIAAALAATAIPAVRAARLEPTAALREE